MTDEPCFICYGDEGELMKMPCNCKNLMVHSMCFDIINKASMRCKTCLEKFPIIFEPHEQICEQMRTNFEYTVHGTKYEYCSEYIKQLTDESKIIDILHIDGTFLKFVDKQTPEICWAAIQNDFTSLQYVKNQTPEICSAAVKKFPATIKYVNEQTPEMCLDAVNNYGWTIEFVDKQTPEICLAAVKKCFTALFFVKEQTPEICLTAVKHNGKSLEYVKEQTLDICLAAINQDQEAIKYVKDEFRSQINNLLTT